MILAPHTGLDRLIDLLLEASRPVERVELTPADAQAIADYGDRMKVFAHEGRLYYRGFRVAVAERSRVVARTGADSLGFPLPERIAS